MKSIRLSIACVPAILLASCANPGAKVEEARELEACKQMVLSGLLKIPEARDVRFLGKVAEATDMCRGGQKAVQFRMTPWADWSQYWGTGDMDSLPKNYISSQGPALRGVLGALLDLEYQRIELIKFNLFDNSGTYKTYVSGSGGTGGRAIKVWAEMRLPKTNPSYQAVGGDHAQECKGDLIRGRTTTGICNDILNPAMGSAGTPFARNVEFETTFPDQGRNELTKNRHGNRLGLLTPDPQVISRKLLTRIQGPDAAGCNAGFGAPDNSPSANCDYQKAPFFNVLAAYWIQFMTHDWFSHMEEGHNASAYIDMGCKTQLVNGVPKPLTPAEIQELGCRPGDRVDQALVANDSPPESFTVDGKKYLARAPKTFANNNTAWWDASQLYGFDETSKKRVKRDPKDPARLLLDPVAGMPGGYLPVMQAGDPIQPQWMGQEAAGFPDNWTIGMSFYHNLFAREHNAFVEEFRRQAADNPNGDSGLRNPANPTRAIANKDVTPEELFTAARLVVSATIAKIHTIEWTPQLLYDEPLYKGMNANWNGLLGTARTRCLKGTFRPRNEGVRKVGGRREIDAVVFGLRLGAGHIRARQPSYGLRHHQARIDEWRRQSLRFAVQFSGGIRHGIPAPSAHSGFDRVPGFAQRPEPDRPEGGGDQYLRGQSDRCHAVARPRQLGPEHGPPKAGAAHPA